MAELLAMQSFNENGAESTLRRMQVLATDMDTMLQCKLLSMAPAAARTAVASREFTTAEELAAALDEAMEKERISSNPAAIPSGITAVSSNTSDEENFIASVRAVYRHTANRGSVHPDQRRRTTVDHASKANPNEGDSGNICYYHNRFGAKARKCTGKPCKFSDLLQPLNNRASN
jgi:uncharacterized protein YfcZ (UPF0381/DUF406 family)